MRNQGSSERAYAGHSSRVGWAYYPRQAQQLQERTCVTESIDSTTKVVSNSSRSDVDIEPTRYLTVVGGAAED